MAKKKGFWASLMAKLDKKMQQAAKSSCGCCCEPMPTKKNKNSCCSK